MAFPSSWVDELLAKNEIVSVISSYIELKPKGRKLWGLCPLHGEKTASFSVSPDKQMFYCFGCHAGGTVIQFVMDMERLPYIEAVQFLAARVGMEMPHEVNDRALQEQRAYRDRLYEATQAAARYYCEQFLTDNGKAAREYAAKRGLSKEIVVRFGIGAAPDGWDALLNHMTKLGYSQKEMIDAGLLVQNIDRNSVYDAYRNRIIFPIIGTNGRVLGFGARVLDDSKPKYINTGDTPIYNKRNNLYGLYQLKNAKLADLIMVEGYMDVIGLYKAGVENAVASLGTALTQQQARLLKRYVEVVYIAYDGDAAGQNATIRGMDILSGEGLTVRIISFPDNLDPDEYVQIYGKEGFDRLKQNALSLNEFKIESMATGLDLGNENEREKYAKLACAYIGKLQPVEQERYYKLLAKKTGYDIESLKMQGRTGIGTRIKDIPLTRGGIRKRADIEDNERSILERSLISAAVQNLEAFKLLISQNGEAYIKSIEYLRLLDAMRAKDFTLAGYVSALEQDEAEHISAVLREEGVLDNPQKTINDGIARLQKLDRDEELADLQQKLKQPDITTEEKAETLQRITALIRANK
ncbi:MAG: DNA primase [Eubacteriales bacterium]|nr:DNA primase [Eubacteriales bacterium]